MNKRPGLCSLGASFLVGGEAAKVSLLSNYQMGANAKREIKMG